MLFKDLENYSILNPDYPYSDIGYAMDKLHTYNFDRNREPLYNCHMNVLDDFSDNRYNFIETTNPGEVFLKLKMMLFRKSMT